LQAAAVTPAAAATGRALLQGDGWIYTYRCDCYCDDRVLDTSSGDCADESCTAENQSCEESCNVNNPKYANEVCTNFGLQSGPGDEASAPVAADDTPDVVVEEDDEDISMGEDLPADGPMEADVTAADTAADTSADTAADAAAPVPSGDAADTAADDDCSSEYGEFEGDERRHRRKSGESKKEKCGKARRDARKDSSSDHEMAGADKRNNRRPRRPRRKI
jgi:hypothetical protein